MQNLATLEDDSRYGFLRRECADKFMKFEGVDKKEDAVDGIFWIPPIYLTAKAARRLHPEETEGKPDDEVALWYVLKRLKETREEQGLKPLYNYLGDNIGPKYERLHKRVALAHARNELFSNKGLTFWPIQTGRARAGESPRRSLLDLKNDPEKYPFKETPVDVYVIVCLLLTHPERANHTNLHPDLYMNAIGSERSPRADGTFADVPYWYWDRARLCLDSNWAMGVNRNYGGVSAFLPE